MKIRPISFRDVTRLLSGHFWQWFAHRFCLLGSFGKKEITTNSLRWPQALHPKKQPKICQVKDSWPWHQQRCWKICRSGSQQKHSKKDAQRRSIDEVVFAKWKRNMTTPRHTAARIRCLPQQTSIACEKKVRWWIWANNTQRNYIASVKRYLKTLRYSESTIAGHRSTVELFKRHLFKRISQFRDDTVVQFVWRLRQRAASCDFAEFNSYSG